MTLYLRLGLAALALLAAAWLYHHVRRVGYDEATTSWEARWRVRDADEAKVGQEAVRANDARQAADQKHSEEVDRDYQDALGRLAGERDSLADRMRQWAANRPVQAGPLPGAPAGAPGTAAAPGNRPDGAEIAGALAAHLDACSIVAERLRALQALQH